MRPNEYDQNKFNSLPLWDVAEIPKSQILKAIQWLISCVFAVKLPNDLYRKASLLRGQIS